MPNVRVTASPRRTVVRAMTGAEVFVKRRWADDWTWLPFLMPTNVNENVAPSMSTATLVYRFGLRKWAEFDSFGIWNFYTIGGAYVRVDAVDPFGRTTLFVGVIDVENVDAHGTVGFASGKQKFECYGLEHILDRNKTHGAVTVDGWIDRPLTFNKTRRRGLELSGNRSGTVFGPGTSKWSNKQIVEYYLEHYVNVLVGPTYALSGTAVDMLDEIEEVHDFDGMTPWQIINQLIDRRRALGWYLDYFADGNGTIFLHVFSSLSVPISVEGSLMAANDNQRTLTFAGFRDVHPTFSFNNLSTYSSILVRGGPIYSCFSISHKYGTAQKGWSDAKEVLYKAGSTVEEADAAAHDIARAKMEFHDVYRRHELVTDWDGYSGDGEGGYGDMVPKQAGPDTFGAERVVTPRDDMFNAMPGVDLFGTFGATLKANYWLEGKTFERTLPIEIDGSDSNDPEYRKMFVVFNVPDDEDPPNDRWVMANGLDAVDLKKVGIQIATSGLAFYLTGDLNHSLALGSFITDDNEDAQDLFDNFDALDTDQDGRLSLEEAQEQEGLEGLTQEELDAMDPTGNPDGPSEDDLENAGTAAADTNIDPVLNFHEMIATVNIKTDWRLFVRWGLPWMQYSETPRELVIDVADTELWVIAEDTVLDVKDDSGDGVLLERQGSSGNIIRNDTSRLVRIAQIAAAWYGQPRSVIKYTTSRITRVVDLGSLVRGVVGPEGHTDVGTVVTSIVHTFSGSATSTTVATNYEELDAKVV